VVLGKGSGLDSVKMWLERLGVQATEEEAGRILMAVKAHSLRTKRLLSEEEFREIVEEILGPERVPAR
jgi:isopropylmalate/homocitrate/citramalate synthase